MANIDNPLNITNLRRLQALLSKLDPTLFEMRTIRANTSIEHICKSVGCILGHCTRLMPKKEFLKFVDKEDGTIDYSGIGKKLFGLEVNTYIWYFLFGSSWSIVDNTIPGAIARIEYIIQNPYANYEPILGDESVYQYLIK
jgi:hypothetical protein